MNTRRTLEDTIIGTSPDGWERHLLTQLWYDKGGMNYFTYKTEPRGYYVAVRIEERRRETGATITRFVLGSSGIKELLAPSLRFSQRTLDTLTPDPAVVARLRQHMLDRIPVAS